MTTTAGARHQRIRERAHQLWEAHQGPDQSPEWFWHQAAAQIRAEEAARDEGLNGSFSTQEPLTGAGSQTLVT